VHALDPTARAFLPPTPSQISAAEMGVAAVVAATPHAAIVDAVVGATEINTAVMGAASTYAVMGTAKMNAVDVYASVNSADPSAAGNYYGSPAAGNFSISHTIGTPVAPPPPGNLPAVLTCMGVNVPDGCPSYPHKKV